MGAFDDYRAAVAKAREWFNDAHPGVLASCDVLNNGFTELGQCLRVGRDADGDSHVSLAPLLLILQRQAFVALDSLASRQAYQAWLLVRPGLESGLFIGKWLDDVANYTVWNERAQNPKRYAREYSGERLRSKSLPRSDALQTSLKTINDLFAHPNPDYYLRHTQTRPIGTDSILLELTFFDSDDFHWASVLSMLHLLILMQDSLARAFAARFVNVDVEPDGYGLAEFQRRHRTAAREAALGRSELRQLVDEIGLWRLAPPS